MRRRVWLASVLIVAVLLGASATGLLYLRSQRARDQVRAYIETTLSRELALPVKVGSVGFSLGLGRIEVHDAAFRDPEIGTSLLEVKRLQVRLELWPLLRRELRVRSVSVGEPRLVVEDSPRFRALAQGLLERLTRLARTSTKARFPVSVDKGVVRYAHPGAGMVVDIEGLHLALQWQGPEQAIASLAGESRLRLAGREIGGIRLGASARLDGDRWEVNRLQLSRGGSALHFQGAVESQGETPRLDLSVSGALALEELRPLIGPEERWKGTMQVNGKFTGNRFPPLFEGTLRLAEGVVKGFTFAQAEATLSVRPDAIEVIALKGRAGGGRLAASGIYEPGEGRYRGRIALEEVSLEEGLQIMGWPRLVAGRLTGSVEGNGQGRMMEVLRLRLDLSGSGLRWVGTNRDAEARLVGSAEGANLKVERLTITRGQSQASARGSVNLTTGALTLATAGAIAALERDLWPRSVDGVSGRLSFSGQLRGTLTAPVFSGQVKGQGLALNAARLDSLEGPVEVDSDRIASQRLRVSVGRSVGLLAGEAKAPSLWRGAGNWQEKLALAVKLDGKGRVEDLARWVPRPVPLGGPFSIQLTASGTPKTLTGTGQLEMQELTVGTERLQSIRAALGFKGSEITIRSLTGSRRGIPFRAEGQLDLSGNYRFALAPLRLDLATVSAIPGLGGTAILSARGAGSFSRPGLEGTLVLADTAFRDHGIGNGRLQFVLDQSQWRWELALDTGLLARGIAPLTLEGVLEAQLSARDFDLSSYLRGLRRQLPFPLAVRADGSVTFTLRLPEFQDVRGQIELTALRCQAGQTSCALRAPASIAIEAGTLRFKSLDLIGSGLSVSVEGSVKPGERTDLELRGYAPLPLIERWIPPVADLKGTPDARVALAGTPGQLRVTGRAELRGVEIKLKPLPIWVAVANGEVGFQNNRVHYVVREGVVAGGRLEGRGASAREGERWRHSFELTLDKARFEQLAEQLQIDSRWVSGNFLLRGSLGFETGPGLAPLKTLAGTLSTALEDGSLSRYPALIRIFGLLGSPAQPLRLPDLAQERMPYRRISADFVVNQGVMETNNLVLDSEVVRVSGVGKVRLAEQTVDFDLGVRLLQVLEGGLRKVPVLGRLLPKEQGLAVIYFDLEGPWNDPKASVAPVKSLSQTVVDLLLFLLRAPDRLLVPQ